MILPIFISIFFGLTAVTQVTLNRILSKTYGVGFSILLNSLVLMSLSVIVYSLTKTQTARVMSEIFINKEPTFQFSPWYLIPGICGFIMITGMPIFITHFNTFSLFIGMITGQLIGSMCVDAFLGISPMTWQKGVGALLAVLGAIISKI